MRRVLDASALLVLLNAESGAEVVSRALPQGVISAVNLSEVIAKLAEAGMPEAAARQVISRLAVEVVPFDAEQSYIAGMLRPLTIHLGLSLGDRACLALARLLSSPALTTDRVWAQLNLGIEIEIVR